MQISHDRKVRKLQLSKEKYIEQVLERFNMKNANSINAPFTSHFTLRFVKAHAHLLKTKGNQQRLFLTQFLTVLCMSWCAIIQTLLMHAICLASSSQILIEIIGKLWK